MRRAKRKIAQRKKNLFERRRANVKKPFRRVILEPFVAGKCYLVTQVPMFQRGRTRRVTGVDFSHFNLATRCLASGGGGGGGCWGCIERPSYIHLSPPTHSPPSLSQRVPLARPPAPSSFPLFPPTFVAFHPFRLFLYLFYLLLLHLLLRLFRLPAQALAHPSRLTYLNPPLSPQSLLALAVVLFSTPTPFRPLSRRLRLAPSHFRSLFL